MISPEDYVKKPVRSLQTMLQTLCAVFPPLPNVIPDGIYGDATCAAVAAFQTFSGLTATGSADHETWNALVACYLHHAPRVLPPEPLRIVLQPGQTIAPGEPACLSCAGDAAGARAVLRKLGPSRRHRHSGRFHAARRAELAGAVRSRADRRH